MNRKVAGPTVATSPFGSPAPAPRRASPRGHPRSGRRMSASPREGGSPRRHPSLAGSDAPAHSSARATEANPDAASGLRPCKPLVQDSSSMQLRQRVRRSLRRSRPNPPPPPTPSSCRAGRGDGGRRTRNPRCRHAEAASRCAPRGGRGGSRLLRKRFSRSHMPLRHSVPKAAFPGPAVGRRELASGP
jgi:hypothetical protein